LYVLEKDQLKRVDFGKAGPPATTYHLSAAEGTPWSIGTTDVMEFAGKAWTHIV
jgi:hypothetical protein